jgi:hypothetical protein
VQCAETAVADSTSKRSSRTRYAYETVANKPITAGAEGGDDALATPPADLNAPVQCARVAGTFSPRSRRPDRLAKRIFADYLDSRAAHAFRSRWHRGLAIAAAFPLEEALQ